MARLGVIRHYARPSPVFGKPVVYIGEVGKPEQGQTEEQIVSWWDKAMGVFLAQQIPWILHWELYCNEIANKDGPKRNIYRAEDLRGFWAHSPGRQLELFGQVPEGIAGSCWWDAAQGNATLGVNCRLIPPSRACRPVTSFLEAQDQIS